ncbi:hypothetical protein ABZW32_00660 [Streptomyces sp. NPDC004667]|uniref:hypothetical protein n=1 Tax=Streptomyces sp. NPDC004667 TaxID=3154285 RepID=UPI0033BC891F
MQSMWRTQVKRITIAIIAAVAIAGGVQIASEGSAADASVAADTTMQPPAAPVNASPSPTATTNWGEWN